MKYSTFACSALALATGALALAPLQPSTRSGLTRPRSIAFEKVKKNTKNLPRPSRNKKRSQTLLQRLDNQDFLYYANVSLGTPGQDLRLHLDTGSSDMWVESPTSDLCQSSGDPCATTGTFDTSTSSTFKNVSTDFQISYVDGEYADGDYGTDVLHLDGADIKGLQFGIGLQSTSTEGILGIGYDTNEVQVQRLGDDPYRNLVDLMVDQKLIRSRAYSLWLNDLESSTGQIMFGGVDTAKFDGNLTTLPIDKRTGETSPREFIITLTSVSLTNDAGKSMTLTDSGFAIPVLLDTGSSYTYLPSDLAKQLWNEAGAQLVQELGVPIVPCDIRDYNGTIDYGFSGANIAVALRELAVDAFQDDGSPATFSDGSLLCYFGILDGGSDTSVLGDTFLRSAFVVFDLDNAEISLGQTRYNVTESNVLEIGTGENSVPDATAAKNPVTVAPTATGANRNNNMPFASGILTRASGLATATGGSQNSAPSGAGEAPFRLAALLVLASVAYLC